MVELKGMDCAINARTAQAGPRKIVWGMRRAEEEAAAAEQRCCSLEKKETKKEEEEEEETRESFHTFFPSVWRQQTHHTILLSHLWPSLLLKLAPPFGATRTSVASHSVHPTPCIRLRHAHSCSSQ